MPPEPPSGTGASPQQDHLVAVAGDLLTLANQHHYPGFAGIVADATGPSLQLFWTPDQPLPPEVAAIVASPRYPVAINRVSAAHDREELQRRSATLMRSAELSPRICGYLHTLVVPEEGYGLRAGVQPYDSAVDPAQYAATTGAILTEVAGVPVHVDVEEAATPLAERQADQFPWWGGARIRAPDRGGCSTGFPVRRPRDGKYFMITAAHCYPQGTAVFNGAPVGSPLRSEIGPVRDFVPGLDVELIEVAPPAQVGKSVYVGKWNGMQREPIAANVGVNVKGINMFVCASGASTGENCLLIVYATNVKKHYHSLSAPGFEQWVTNLVSVRSLFQGGFFPPPAAGTGDSGGPVIKYQSGAPVLPVGIISSGTRLTACRDAAFFTFCFRDLHYADLDNVVQTLGLVVNG